MITGIILTVTQSEERALARFLKAIRVAARKRLRARKVHAVFQNMVLVAVSSLSALLLVEAILRESSLSDRLGWTRNESVEERVERLSMPSAERLRILGLGDSFSEYRDSERKNYLRFMERCATDRGILLEVVNLSRAGTGIGSYRETFRRYSSVVDADIVIIGIYLGNDIQCPPDTVVESAARRGHDGSIRAIVKKHSVLINYAFRQLKHCCPTLRSGAFERNLELLRKQYGVSLESVDQRLRGIETAIIEMSKSDLINPWLLATSTILPDYYRHNYLLSSEESKRTLECFLSFIDKFGGEVLSAGSVPVFVLVPDSILVAEHYRKVYERLGFNVVGDLHNLDPVPLIDVLEKHLRSRGFAYVDLLRSLRNVAGEIYIPVDIHFNTVGQQAAGEALCGALVQSGLI